MAIKITTLQQVGKLHIGDVLLKSPTNEEARNNEQYKEYFEAYEISYINPGNQMIYLITPASARTMFPSPGDVGRLFVKVGHLITENVWWLP